MIKTIIISFLWYIACGIAVISMGRIRYTLVWIAEVNIMEKILMVLLWPIILFRMMGK